MPRDGAGSPFEDDETAEILNEHFIAVKVDREEHPDLDEIYMTAVQLITGGGGWPLSVFLTPDLTPFFGGTYFPPEDHRDLPSFKAVLRAVAELWQRNPTGVARGAEEIVHDLQAGLTRSSHAGPIDVSLFENAAADLKSQFDPAHGGFGGAPKFPDTGAIAFLLRQHLCFGDDKLLQMAAVTLDHMACGGHP